LRANTDVFSDHDSLNDATFEGKDGEATVELVDDGVR
jgi:hypothetical protein